METSRERKAPEELAPSASSIAVGTLPARLPQRVFDALTLLYESHAYAHDLGKSPWDFAVELRSLRRLGLTNSDFRWLVGKQLVDFAREMTLPGERQRSFRRAELLSLTPKTCFVLTTQGVSAAEQIEVMSGEKPPFATEQAVFGPVLSGTAHTEAVSTRSQRHAGARTGSGHAKSSNGRFKPQWDRDRQELRVGDQVVKQFKVPAANQETILAAFEEEHWPPRIDDPLPPQKDQDSKRRLHDTINSLNRNQKCSLVRFLGDGSGTGVRWEFVDASHGAQT